MVVFYETEPPTDEASLDAVEKYVGLQFPVAYRQHILQTNGGRCEPNVFRFYERGVSSVSSIGWFLPIGDEHKSNLRDDIQALKIESYRIPHRMIPIASDSLGNLICISCAEEDLGYVYFWDHELEPEIMTEPFPENLYLIATSFPEFLASLTLD
jgi:SMI1-KNR4 cell-wall